MPTLISLKSKPPLKTLSLVPTATVLWKWCPTSPFHRRTCYSKIIAMIDPCTIQDISEQSK
ncbi:uncharacterized protein M6B38_124535 [Iris pallida]|uniref:Uncharacterized protein n=1 Tax=Iris pallida TaxID=29817 RepID=A0AAX6H3S3_IRIPA|nr:uncharacterized protein M6B38_124535 [Iris pallida]